MIRVNISNVKIAILPLRAEREFKGGGSLRGKGVL